MTEHEWLACAKPEPMLKFLQGKASERKLRLFACACCRRIWRLLTHADSRAVVDVAERYADGLERKKTLTAARRAARRVALAQRGVAYNAWGAARENIQAAVIGLASGTAWCASHRPLFGSGPMAADMADVERELAALAALVRDAFGNPFQSVVLDPAVRTTTVGNLANAAYSERRFTDLPVLADALEDAGCSDEAILSHLRGPGPHVRACWVVDLILGKQ